MKTPKQKAEYLIRRFMQEVRPWVDWNTQKREAKNCASVITELNKL